MCCLNCRNRCFGGEPAIGATKTATGTQMAGLSNLRELKNEARLFIISPVAGRQRIRQMEQNKTSR
jgi:hypothetical protein